MFAEVSSHTSTLPEEAEKRKKFVNRDGFPNGAYGVSQLSEEVNYLKRPYS